MILTRMVECVVCGASMLAKIDEEDPPFCNTHTLEEVGRLTDQLEAAGDYKKVVELQKVLLVKAVSMLDEQDAEIAKLKAEKNDPASR